MQEVRFQNKSSKAGERNPSFLLSFRTCNIPSIFLSEFKGRKKEQNHIRKLTQVPGYTNMKLGIIEKYTKIVILLFCETNR